ncbi:MAG: hypothetical protein A2289_05665 [Deltaproteobacteria bacterium RIFOXYA12_FULL_58_15]|nr:MAG: hypothetical protein A2289_05665 [Deltaproteobacteria bacterium RIFOXYA12_FULL_58_15]OGR07527.1 MAG: hypothetical protein A2341_26505 [Deltaproteobacteria bacterium RIFOXYB12_FULL_58_9]
MVTTLLIGIFLAVHSGRCVAETGGLLVQMDGIGVEVGSRQVQLLAGVPVVDATGAALQIIAGNTDSGQFELLVSDKWQLRRGDESKTLEIPGIVGKSGQVKILGGHGQYIWLACHGALVRIDVDTGNIESARLRRCGLAKALHIGAEARIVLGDEVLQCAAPKQCESVGHLPITPEHIVSGPSGILFGGSAGLFRSPSSHPTVAVQVAKGEVRALCGDPKGTAWALVESGNEEFFVAASTEVPAARMFIADELVGAGMNVGTETGVALEVLRRTAEARWSSLTHMALAAVTDSRVDVRERVAQILPELQGSQVAAAIWLLGHDVSARVRVEALHASRARCLVRGAVGCTSALSAFVNDGDPEVGWTARDWLLEHDPEVALADAPVSYKLDAITILVSRLQRHGERLAERGLEILAADSDVEVRAAASLALAGIDQ